MTAVSDRPAPLDQTIRVQLGQQHLVEPLPNTGPLPLIQPPVTRRAAAEAKLGRQVPPRHPGVQHKQNPLQRPPVRLGEVRARPADQRAQRRPPAILVVAAR